jgi:hypothetical protein
MLQCTLSPAGVEAPRFKRQMMSVAHPKRHLWHVIMSLGRFRDHGAGGIQPNCFAGRTDEGGHGDDVLPRSTPDVKRPLSALEVQLPQAPLF